METTPLPVAAALDRIHATLASETELEGPAGGSASYFSHPCSDAITAVDDAVFRLLPKLLIGKHEDKQFEKTFGNLPRVVSGFLVKNKQTNVTFGISKELFDK